MGCPPGQGKPGSEAGQHSVLPTRRAGSETNGRARSPGHQPELHSLRKAGSRRTIRLRRALPLAAATAARVRESFTDDDRMDHHPPPTDARKSSSATATQVPRSVPACLGAWAATGPRV